MGNYSPLKEPAIYQYRLQWAGFILRFRTRDVVYEGISRGDRTFKLKG